MKNPIKPPFSYGFPMVFFPGWGVGAGRAAGRCFSSRAAVTMGLAGAMEIQKDPGEAGNWTKQPGDIDP